MHRVRVGQAVVIPLVVGQPAPDWAYKRPYYVLSRHHSDVVLMRLGDDYRTTRNIWDLSPAHKPDATVLYACRADNYKHWALIVGRRMIVTAGCRYFPSLARAVKHWTGRRRYNQAYPPKSPHRDGIPGRWKGSRFIPTHTTKGAADLRAKDRKLNAWSLAFARKAERIRAKN